MNNFSIELQNVGCIKEGKISVNANQLNIKFGPNGIGKTTIIKALKYKINGEQDLKKAITSLDNPGIEPTCEVTEEIQNVVVYDKAYFDKLFTKREDLLNDTYQFVIKDDTYDKEVERINDSLKKVCEIARRNEFSTLIQLYNELTAKSFIDYKKNGKGINSRNSLFSAFSSNGIDLMPLDSQSPIFELSKYMSSPYRANWLKWIESYDQKWTIENICPFCGQRFEKEDFSLKENVEEIEKFGTSKEVMEHNKEQKYINDSASYCSDLLLSESISRINSLKGKANMDTFVPLQKFIDEIKSEIEKINDIRGQGAIALFNAFLDNNKKFENLIEYIKSLKLNDKILCVVSIQNDSLGDLVKVLNYEIDSLIGMAESLKSTLLELTKNLAVKIAKNEKLINNFLKIAGLPYEVNIHGVFDASFKTLFKYKNDPNIIEDRLNYLSFGEANALAIIIFAIENKDNVSLMVLDDPVSSFDNNKRYAIFNYLFGNTKSLLYGKTILLMTHDFQTVVAFAKNSRLKNYKKSFSYLYNVNHFLNEKTFSTDDVYSSLLWYKEYAKNGANDIYSRIVAARRIVEIQNETTADLYNYLSGLIHPIVKPKHSKNGLDFSDIEIEQCDSELSKLLGEKCKYQEIYSQISNFRKLIEWYEGPKATNFSKTCITRCLVEQLNTRFPNIKDNIEFDVMWDYMCDSFHIETQYIYSIKDICITDIPNYIISLCDEIISKVKKGLNL
ncbi:MAG: hypothetical protein PUC70_01035 [bacterium]|nr:hypothetical protein [bacterium]